MIQIAIRKTNYHTNHIEPVPCTVYMTGSSSDIIILSQVAVFLFTDYPLAKISSISINGYKLGTQTEEAIQSDKMRKYVRE